MPLDVDFEDSEVAAWDPATLKRWLEREYPNIVQRPAPQWQRLPPLDAEPAAPRAGCILFVTVNGSSKHELRAIFPTGVSQVVSTEP